MKYSDHAKRAIIIMRMFQDYEVSYYSKADSDELDELIYRIDAFVYDWRDCIRNGVIFPSASVP